MESLGWEYVSNVSQKLFLALWSLFVSVFFPPPHGPQKVRNDVLLLEQIDEAAGMCFQPSYINRSVL